MGKFNVTVEKTDYEVRAFNNTDKNIALYEIFKDGIKQFAIKPTLIFNDGGGVLWKLTEENKSRQIDYSTVAKLGAAIEAYGN